MRMPDYFKLWLYKVRVILDYLKQGKLLLLLKKVFLNRQKRQRLLLTMGKKVKPSFFTLSMDRTVKTVLIIDQYLGGGANFHREQKINDLLASNKAVILLLNDPLSSRFLLCYIHPTFRCYTQEKHFDQCMAVCAETPVSEIMLNNCVSYANAADIPLAITALQQKTHCKLSLFLHDYFSICPSYNLLNDKDQFCGIPELSTCRNCLAHHTGHFKQLLPNCDIDSWRKQWQTCLTAADSIYAFSNSSIDLLSKAYPALDRKKILLQPHKVNYIHYQPRIKKQDGLHIAIVGNINRVEKGRDIVLEMVKLIEQQNLPVKMTVIGSLDEAPKSMKLNITGPYEREQLPHMLEQSGANLCFLPSIWPETFSYICEEIMQMNFPLAVFDLGAPAERVKNYSKGVVIPVITANAALKNIMMSQV